MKDSENRAEGEKKGMGLQVARNSVFGAVQAVISVSVLFFVTPYILENLGIERYAVWALVGLITTYGMLSDFGMTKALVYFIPKARVEGGIDRINKFVNTAMSFYLVAVTIVMAVLFLLRNVIVVYLFKVPDSLYAESLFVVSGAILVFGVSIISGVYNPVLFGYQRVDIASVILIGYSIIDPIGLFLVLKSGYGLPGMIMSRLVATILMALALWIAANRIARGLRFNLLLSSRSLFVDIFKYGINTQVASIAWLLDTSITKLLLPTMAGLSYVSYYHLAYRTRMRASALFRGAMGSVTPAAAELHASDDRLRLQRLYFRSMRYIFLFALPMFLLISILSQPFVRVWLGDGFELVATTIILMALPAFVSLLRRSSNEILRGIGLVRPITYVSIGTVIAHLILSVVLGWRFGYYGVVMGMVIVSLIASMILIRICYGSIGTSPVEITKHLSVGAMVLALVLAALAILIMRFSVNMGDIFNLFVIGAGYLVCYFAGIVGFRLLDSMDLSLIYKLLPNWIPVKRFFKV